MRFEVHAVYPGVSLVVVGEQSVLFGVPADAFKAVKQHCMDHNLPFPRTLVAPQDMLVNATPRCSLARFTSFSYSRKDPWYAGAGRGRSSQGRAANTRARAPCRAYSWGREFPSGQWGEPGARV